MKREHFGGTGPLGGIPLIGRIKAAAPPADIDPDVGAAKKAAGKLGDSRGRAFERFLDTHILQPAVKNRLLVRIDRQHPVMVPTNHRDMKGRPLFALGASSGTDWIALLPKGSWFSYLPMEAKATGENALPLSAFAEQQIQHLNAAVDAGGDGLLFVQYSKPFPENFLVPWSKIPWRSSGNGHSLPKENMSETWRLRGWTCIGRVLDLKP